MKFRIIFLFVLFAFFGFIHQAFAEAGAESRGYLENAKSYTAKKDYKKASEYLDKFQSLEPGSPFGFGLRGYIFYRQKRYEEAIHQYNRAIEIKDDYIAAYVYRGRCYSLTGKDEKAEADYKRALELDPKEKEALFNLAELYRQSEKYEKSIDSFNKLLKLDPNDAQAFNYRGMAKRELKMYDDAASDHSQAIHLKAGYISAYINRGRALMLADKDNLALRDFNYAAQLEPKRGETYYFRGLLLEKMDRIEEAKADFRKFLELDPEFYRKHRKEIEKKLAKYEKYDSIKSDIAVFIVINDGDPAQRETAVETKEVFGKLTEANTEGEGSISAFTIKELRYNETSDRKTLDNTAGFDKYKIPFAAIAQYQGDKPVKLVYVKNLKLNRFGQYEEFFNELKKYRNGIKITRLKSTVDITTNPPKASVYIDGKRLTPVTPFTGYELPAGEHRMIVKKDGYPELERKFFLRYGEKLVIDDLMMKSKNVEEE